MHSMGRMSPLDPRRAPPRQPGATAHPSSAALVADLRRGDRHAYALLVERHAAELERVLLRILGPDTELDDLLHEVLVAAMTSLHTLRDPDKLRGWLVSIAVNKARKRIRTRTRWRFIRLLQPAELPEREAPAVSPEVSEALRCTYEVLSQMGPDDRIFFALRFVDGMELKAIAEHTGVSLATVKRRLSRARRAFMRGARQHAVLLEWIDGEPES